MRQKIIVYALLAITIAMCAWPPWITQARASGLAEAQFNHAWNGVIDGCGTSGDNLGATEFRKIPFGAMVRLDYLCGLVMPDEPPVHTDVYVSFFGVAFGNPRP